ncbi:MAG: SCO6880 family protein [Acidimicrobiales bacterium]
MPRPIPRRRSSVPAEGGRYRFPPLERRGVIAGIGANQLAVAAGGCLVAFFVLQLVSGVAGVGLAVALVAATAAGACWHVRGLTPGGWAPIAAAWLRRRAAGQPQLSDIPGVGTTLAGPPRAAPPRALVGVSIASAPEVPGSPPMGVVRDVKAGTLAAMLAVHGRSFSLLDPTEKQRRLDAWGTVLAGLCREGSPVHRLQWLERAMPGERDGLRRYLEDCGRRSGPDTADRPDAAHDSYRELITTAGPVGQAHASLVILAIHIRKANRSSRAFGRGPGAACGVLRRELRLLQGQLRQAELTVDRVLAAPEVAAAVRAGFDPATTSGEAGGAMASGARHPASERALVWPTATDEEWGALRADGSWHVTYWVAEWPRIDVGSDFLSPLLLTVAGCRAASVVMAPVPPGRAAREAEAARTADMADEKLRQKAGFLTTARRQRQAEGVLRRESELADGHAEYRYSGYVTVSAASLADLEVSCAEIEQAAHQSNLELRRLYGQQAEAFTWTLPLARGLKS